MTVWLDLQHTVHKFKSLAMQKQRNEKATMEPGYDKMIKMLITVCKISEILYLPYQTNNDQTMITVYKDNTTVMESYLVRPVVRQILKTPKLMHQSFVSIASPPTRRGRG